MSFETHGRPQKQHWASKRGRFQLSKEHPLPESSSAGMCFSGNRLRPPASSNEHKVQKTERELCVPSKMLVQSIVID